MYMLIATAKYECFDTSLKAVRVFTHRATDEEVQKFKDDLRKKVEDTLYSVGDNEIKCVGYPMNNEHIVIL